MEFRVLRQGATEQPFTGEYDNETAPGVYCCRGCGAELFTSGAKFSSHCGWPSFFEAADDDRVTYHEDRSIPGSPRTEVRCARCGSHLGHVFAGEGYETPTDLRFCINSICLELRPTTAHR
jgi:peptide-methionine (R)-S-oxide reductase